MTETNLAGAFRKKYAGLCIFCFQKFVPGRVCPVSQGLLRDPPPEDLVFCHPIGDLPLTGLGEIDET